LLTRFKQLTLDEMTQEDLDYLADVVSHDPEMDPSFIYKKMAHGEMIPWRLETTRGNSIVLTEVKHKRFEKTLYVWYLSGKGFVGHAQYMLDTFEEYCKLNGCTAIEALMEDQRLANYFKRGKFNIKHVFVRREVN